MKQFKHLVWLFCLIGLIGFRLEVAQGAQINLRFAGSTPADHYLTRGLELFAKLIEQKTNGAVAVQVYPGGQLFTDRDLPKAIPSGAVDGGVVNLTFWSGMVPTLNALFLPFHYTDHNQSWRTVDGEPGKLLIQDLKEKGGVKLLYWIDFGFADFISKKPMRTLQDVKGKRIRAYGEEDSVAFSAMGAAPVTMVGGEVYMALQRGTIDATPSGTSTMWEKKYYEIAKHLTIVGFQYGVFGVLMNQKRWEGLSPEIQKGMAAAAQEAQEWGRKEALKVNKEAIEQLKSKGVEVYVLPKDEKTVWRNACSPARDHYLKRTGERGKLLLELIEKVR